VDSAASAQVTAFVWKVRKALRRHQVPTVGPVVSVAAEGDAE
jgi:hypothetical protein